MLKNLCLAGSVFAFTVMPALAQKDIDLPQLGTPADLTLSPAQEAKLGAQVVAEMYRGEYIVEDPEITDYLSAIGWKLAAADITTPTPPPFRFYLIADNRINAFALPGGYIGFNAGTILAASNESELAGVLAHEESHVTQRHIARAAGDTQMADLATWAAMLAAIIAGSANPNVVMGALALGQGINYQRQVAYTRGDELEADRFGIRKLAAAGYDPMGMATFFGRLQQETRLYGSHIPEILLDHPVNTTRIAEATERAAQYGPRSVKDSIDFAFMRGRTRVLAADSPNEAMGYFEGEINAGHDSLENRYGYAMALSEIEQNDQAAAALQPLLQAYPRQPNVLLLQAKVLIGQGKVQDGLDVYDHILATSPHYAPAALKYAEALINAGKPQLARQVLLAHGQGVGARPEAYRLLSAAARAAGNTAEAQYQQANYLFSRGDLRGAVEQLNAGLRVASIGPDDRARLVARRKELMQTIPRDELERLQRQPAAWRFAG
ncbi:MAG: M48 family metallopeptidase [Nevskia sp.]|nr:M48 family metallopeptidase [Nevskia sp.]